MPIAILAYILLTMNEKEDYYKVLGIDKNASDAEIKTAFRKLSRQFHPDLQVGKSDDEKKQAEEKFKNIAEAYEVLSDKDKRQQYDTFGFNSNNTMFNSAFDMYDFMNRSSSMFGDMFADFGFSRPTRRKPNIHEPENGQHVRVQTTIDFKKSISGCTTEFDVMLSDPCPDCNGTGTEKNTDVEICHTCNGTGSIKQTSKTMFGMSIVSRPCHDCYGTGYKIKKCHTCNGTKRIKTKKHIKVKIPKGVFDGQRLRLKGLGECGVCGGQNGNMYVDVHVEDSELFTRINDDIHVILPISPIVATIGGKVDVPTPYGYHSLDIKPGIQPNSEIVINGKGIQTENNVGNLIVTIVIEPFINLNKDQTELLKEFSTTTTNDNLKMTSMMKQLATKFYS